MSDLLDLNDAAKLIGVQAPSLRRSLGSGSIPGIQIQQGNRKVWRIQRAVINAMLSGQSIDPKSDYDSLIAQWEREQASGYHSGRPVGRKAIQLNRDGIGWFWRYLRQAPSTAGLTPGNLKTAISSVPVDYEAKNCHFVQREHMYKAVLSFTQFLIRQGLRTDADLIAMRSLKPKRIFPPRRTSLKTDALQKLLNANRDFMHGRSEFDQQLTRTAILIMSLSGLRRSEALDLEVSQLDLERGTLRVIDGKGHKDRVAGMPSALVEQLRIWIHRWRPSTKAPQVLIMADGRPLTESAIQQRIARLRKKAGIDITLHGLRRTCATLMVDSGVPLVHVQRNLGHSDIKTTMSYVMTDAETAAESFRRFEF